MVLQYKIQVTVPPLMMQSSLSRQTGPMKTVVTFKILKILKHNKCRNISADHVDYWLTLTVAEGLLLFHHNHFCLDIIFLCHWKFFNDKGLQQMLNIDLEEIVLMSDNLICRIKLQALYHYFIHYKNVLENLPCQMSCNKNMWWTTCVLLLLSPPVLTTA